MIWVDFNELFQKNKKVVILLKTIVLYKDTKSSN